MKFAFCNEMFEDRPLSQALAAGKALGYSGVEFAPFTLAPRADLVTAGQRRQIRSQVRDCGLETVGLHWLLAKTEGFYLTSPEASTRRHTAEYFATLAHLCADLGGHILVLGSPRQRNLLPGVTHEEAMKYAAEVIRLAEPALRERRVTLAIEPLGPGEGNFLNTAASGIALARLVDSPWVRLHLDIKAMCTEALPATDIVRESADWTAHFHANDPNLLGPGMGEVDVCPILQALQATGYQGWVSVEVFDYRPGPEHILRESMRCLQACLGGPT